MKVLKNGWAQERHENERRYFVLMVRCTICSAGLNSTYIRIGRKSLPKKVGFYCVQCDLYLDLNYAKYEKPCTVNEKPYTVLTKSDVNADDSRRAGGLAWLRYRLDMAGVEGSNPFRPTLIFSVGILTLFQD